MRKEDGKKYPCESIQDIVDLVTVDNWQDVAHDLYHWVALIAAAKATGTGIKSARFIWVDDGVRGVSEVQMKTRREER